MDQQDIINALGKPNRVNPPKRLYSHIWLCSACKARAEFAQAVTAPAPCDVCGSIFFETPKVEADHG